MHKPIIKCAFYGSLRQGLYNYLKLVNSFSTMEVQYIGTERVPYWDMYLVHISYPAIKKSTLKHHTIVVDLFSISDRAYDFVYGMETDAGYHEEDIDINGEKYIIFPYDRMTNINSLILSGDFKNFVESKKLYANEYPADSI